MSFILVLHLTKYTNSVIIALMEETETNKSYGKKSMGQWVVIYLVIAVIVYGAIYYLFLAIKGGPNYNSSNSSYKTQPTSPSSTPQAMMSHEITVNLAAENNSGESGTAVLKEENGKTTVTINLTGYTKDVSQPAHIHIGACPGVGAVKYPLTDMVNGKSVTVLSVTLDQLKQSLPLGLNVHKSDQEITNYTACGELSSK